MNPLRRVAFVCLLAIFCLPFPATSATPASATLCAVVSDNSAPDLATGAREFNRLHPGHRLIFRTTSQLMDMAETDLHNQMLTCNATLVLGVFSDAAQRLLSLLQQPGTNTSITALNSDKRLEALSRSNGMRLTQSISETDLQTINTALNDTDDPAQWLHQYQTQYPDLQPWLSAKMYWQNRGAYNIGELIASQLQPFDRTIHPRPPQPLAPVRYYFQDKIVSADQVHTRADQALVAVLDLNTGDRADSIELHQQLCQALTAEQVQCVSVFAPWGKKTLQAIQGLQQQVIKGRLGAIITLEDFLLGGGDNHEAVTTLLQQLDVPVIKGIRLHDRSAAEWQLSREGIPVNAVHYRIAMPEMQGISQPMVLATASEPALDPLTGLRLRYSQPEPAQIKKMARRTRNWIHLQQTPNADKRVAIIYYNHPPGRHNIGADNLDVPATLWDLLHLLKDNGYKVGTLPGSQAELLDLMQEKAVNLPEDYAALKKMAPLVTRIPAIQYQAWFDQFPSTLQAELSTGPLGYLHQSIGLALREQKPEIADALRQQVITDLRHLLEGAEHPARDRALDLLTQLDAHYQQLIRGTGNWQQSEPLLNAIVATQIEGLRGWGKPPGKVMVYNQELLLPGIQFGNVFIGPQPPRGWELNEELLHANLSVPPPHQYLALYQWLQNEFKADALIHLGRHSTYEFLPRHGTGLGDTDYAPLIAGDLPGIYPYIVDGVGEGIQAKRRGLAVMIDHLTPPLSTTPLYDDLLALRQLIETYEANESNADSPAAKRAITNIHVLIDKMHLRDELIASMDAELKIRGIRFEEVNNELLVHEIGHYLTKLQEKFMPLGLHVLARDWSTEALDTMLKSMQTNQPVSEEIKQNLAQSPAHERRAILHALAGGFIAPGKGNDPIKTPEALPTGRNFHALDGSLLPTRLGYELGVELANDSIANNQHTDAGKEAVILWASDVVRDEGAMIGFGLHLLGVRPVWNSRGILQGIERVPLQPNQQRHDTVFITSGLFRDLYGQQLALLDQAVLLALAGSSNRIRAEFPELGVALDAALAPLADAVFPAAEPLQLNQVAQHWVQETRQQLQQGITPKLAGRNASLRLFGSSPGSYGAGINRLAERSGSWNNRKQLGQSYLERMGHAYGINVQGSAQQALFKSNLQQVQNTYLGRSSNLYGLIDNNDAFDYLGGLSLAVETLSGAIPDNHVMFYADSNNPEVKSLDAALLGELRSRFLNPAWMQALMQHDYAGARTMGSEFIEYLWGWQITNPDIIKSWVWDEVKAVYLDDRYTIGVDKFLDNGHNQQVKANMLAIMLVAAMKGFWETDTATLETLSSDLVEMIRTNGLPGSGHTTPDHPLFEFVQAYITREQSLALNNILQQARYPEPEPTSVTTHIAELTTDTAPNSPPADQSASAQSAAQAAESTNTETNAAPPLHYLVWLAGLALLLVMGVLNGRRQVA